jgi:hypothetical protein
MPAEIGARPGHAPARRTPLIASSRVDGIS